MRVFELPINGRCLARFETFVCQFEFRKLESRRDRAAHQRILTQRTRALPCVRGHDDLRTFAVFDSRAQHEALRHAAAIGNFQFERRAAMIMPCLRRIDAMPVRDLACLQQKINRCRKCAAI